MKAQIQKLPLSEQSSFMADRFYTPDFETPWHYHPEYEIVLILQGRGKRFIGNHVSDYETGDIFFLGSNLPHLFRKDEAAGKGGSLVIHFLDTFLGDDFRNIPEMRAIMQLFERARMGIRFYGEKKKNAASLMDRITGLQGMDRLISLLELLQWLAFTEEYELLSSPEIIGQNSRDSDRLNSVFDYVMRNFREDIDMREIAGLANMSYSGFCRYFKNRTRKTFTHFVNEIRIGYACRKLMEPGSSVSRTCYDSGFNNMTNFMEQFRKIVKTTPHQYRKALGG